jgi:hypothetical protein
MHGPVDFIALEFKGNQFSGEIMPALKDLIDNKTIRVIDLVVVMKDAEGNVTSNEVRELNQHVITTFDPLKAEISGMIKVADIQMIAEKLEPNCTAALMLFEHLWAVRFKETLVKANGRLLMNERIPENVVEEALQDLALGG